jgi:hypothetical protein
VNRRAGFVALVSAAAAALAGLFYRAGFPGVIYDAFHYLTLSQIVSTEGLWNLSSRVRGYGYPLFLAAITGFSDPAPETVRLLAAVAQVAIHLGVALYAARVVERAFASRRAFLATYALMALNPISLIHATELLADSLSASLLALALFTSIDEGHPQQRAFLAFLAAGLSVAVRPASLAVLPALAVLWLLRARLHRERLLPALAPAALAVAIALAPQLHGNVKGYDAWTPLLVDRLYARQVEWGTAVLKYGTLVMPGREPQIVYGNPLRPEGVDTPREFFRQRPLGYVKTLAAHGFAMFDQDLPFTYVTDPRPGYRWPLSLANYAFLFLAGLGLARILTRDRESPAGLYGAGAALFSAALVAVYLPVAVENRFSLPLYPILTPAAVYAAYWTASRRSGTIVAVAIAGGGFVAACVQVSIWLTKQAPALSALAGR